MYQTPSSLDERAPLAVASIAISAVFVVLGALALCIRFMSRRIQGLQLGFNDYAALLAWVRRVIPFYGAKLSELMNTSL